MTKTCIQILPRCTPTTSFSDDVNYDCDGNVIDECDGSDLSFPEFEVFDSGFGELVVSAQDVSSGIPVVYIGQTIRAKILNYDSELEYGGNSYTTITDDIVTWIEPAPSLGGETHYRTFSIAVFSEDGECSKTNRINIAPEYVQFSWIQFIENGEEKIEELIEWDDRGWILGSGSGAPSEYWNRFQNNTEVTEIIHVQLTENITYLSNTFRNMPNLVKFGTMSGSIKLRSFSETWQDCTSLEDIGDFGSLPELYSINGAWKGCISLTSFPLLDTSNCGYWAEAFSGCSGLTSFPALDTSNAQYLGHDAFYDEGAWHGCSGLTSFPSIDTSKVISFNGTWYGCTGLTSFPSIDTSSGVRFRHTWMYCSSLTSFPSIDTSNGLSFSSTWWGCSSLVDFGSISYASATIVDRLFQDTSSLQTMDDPTGCTPLLTEADFVRSSLCPLPCDIGKITYLSINIGVNIVYYDQPSNQTGVSGGTVNINIYVKTYGGSTENKTASISLINSSAYGDLTPSVYTMGGHTYSYGLSSSNKNYFNKVLDDYTKQGIENALGDSSNYSQGGVGYIHHTNAHTAGGTAHASATNIHQSWIDEGVIYTTIMNLLGDCHETGLPEN